MQLSKKMVCLGAVVALLALVGCNKNGSKTAGGQTEYVVGTDATYAPFEFQNDKRELEGFDIDIIKAVADKAGLKIKLVNTPWEGLFASLQQGDCDLLISAITITDERKQTMGFSDPYFEAHQLIAVGHDVSTVSKFVDLEGMKVAVQTGTTGDDLVQRLMGKTNPNIKRFESVPLALQELKDGGVQAVVADNGVVVNFIKNNPSVGFKVVSDSHSFQEEFYGIAVKKGNHELLQKIDMGVRAMKADGSYDKIYAKWFAK